MTRRTIAFIVFAFASTLTPVAWTQTTCDPPRICASGDEINAAADAACRRARVAESDTLPACLSDLDKSTAGTNQCRGELRACEAARALLAAQKTDRRRPLSLWLEVPLTVGAVGFGVASGLCVGAKCPGELTVGFAVTAGLLTVGKILADIIFR